MTARRPSSTNISALHIFAILRLVSRSSVPLGPADLSRLLQAPVSTVHRALMTLEETGYISRYNDTGQYQSGQMPEHLSRALFHRFPLHDEIRPYLRRMADDSGATASLCVRIGWFQMTIAVVYGADDLYHRVRLGRVCRLHSGVASRAILAYLPPADLKRYVAFCRASGDDEAGLDDALLKACQAVRETGYALEEDDSDEGPAAVALPVRSATGEAVASILVTSHRKVSRQSLARQLAWRDEVERRLAQDPDRARHPYEHIEPDAIRFDVAD